jgi:hypothetical protein
VPPPHEPWYDDFFGAVGSAVLECVPAAGPLLSACFGVAWAAITDPETFGM